MASTEVLNPWKMSSTPPIGDDGDKETNKRSERKRQRYVVVGCRGWICFFI